LTTKIQGGIKMANRDELIKQTVVRLQLIKTLDEYKAAREEIIDLMEKIFKSALDTLKDFFENMFSMSPEEKQTKSSEFQDESYLLNPEIMKEIERLDNLPGGAEYAESFVAELEKRLGHYMEEIAEQMGKIMENFMGDTMSVAAEAMGAEEVKDEVEDKFEFDSRNPDTPAMLYSLYAARSLYDLVVNKDNLIKTIEEELDYNIGELKTMTDPDFVDYKDWDLPSIEKIRYLLERLVPEMNKEFARIAAMPEAAETAGNIQKQVMDRLATMFTEMNGILAKIKKGSS